MIGWSPVRLHLLDKDAHLDLDLDDEVADDTGRDEERVVRCAACDHEITKHKARFRKDGRDDHVFTNPHGFTFRIACFRTAPGVGAVGEESDEWAWFPGSTWQTVACRGCLTHLGWVFHQGESSFFGLILSKLVL